MREGDFTTRFPDAAGSIVLALANALGVAHGHLMLAFADDPHERRFVDEALARALRAHATRPTSTRKR